MNLKPYSKVITVLFVLLLSSGLLSCQKSTSSKASFAESTGSNVNYLTVDGKYYADYSSFDEEQKIAKELSIKIAEEGDVLLKNENNLLPLSKDYKYITLFGMHSVDLIPSGAGSAQGDLGNNGIEPSTLKLSMEKAGFVVNNKTLSLYETHKKLGTTKNELPLSYYQNSITSTYKGFGDAAIVTISRLGAENSDLKTYNVNGHSNPEDHALQLDDTEVMLIKHVKKNFNKVIVLINSSNIMQIPDLAAPKTDDNLGVDAILWIGNTGNNAIEAVGKIINGTTNPSGHTVDIWLNDFKKDPTFANFSSNGHNKDSDGNRLDSFLYFDGEDSGYRTVEYREGIYMGYRYFETMKSVLDSSKKGSGYSWYKENVLYPFGYGLSYTTFDWSIAETTSKSERIKSANQKIFIDVEVKNSGDYPGKDVVQIYFNPPYKSNGIEKATVNMVGFAKTKLLQPGESEVVRVEFVAQDMASFDYNDANKNGFKGFELEKGIYEISARYDSNKVAFSIKRDVKSDIFCKTDYTTGSEIKPVFVDDYTTVNKSLLNNQITRTDLSYPLPASKEDRTISKEIKTLLDSQMSYASYQDDESQPWFVRSKIESWSQAETHQPDFSDIELQLKDMSGIPYTQSTIVDGVVQLSTDENSKKWDAFMNQLTWSEMVSLIVSGGGTTEIKSIGKAKSDAYDGSTQIKDGTLWASAPILAATFNTDLAYEQGRMIGNESIFAGHSAWYGPSMNIHRSPFSGRNFEYYSQDGVQGGIMAASVIEGVSSKGTICFTKHLFLNDQEAYRGDQGGVLVMANEQAIREIYGKNFEFAIKSGSLGFMSAFNRIGYVGSSLNYALHQRLLRDEWGFTGYSVTDAWIKAWVPLDLMVRAGDEEVLGEGSSSPEYSIEKGVWDPSLNTVLVKNSPSAIKETLPSYTHYYAIRKAAQRILYTIANSNANRNGIVPGADVDLYLEKSVVNNVPITIDASNDITVEIEDGYDLPAGVSLDNIVVNGIPTEEGTYSIPINILVDGWVKSKANLNIQVNSALHYNGKSVNGKNIDTIQVGDEYSGVFTVPYYSYQNIIPQQAGWSPTSRVLNWYIDPIDRPLIGPYDKTAADIVTADPKEAKEAHVYHFTYEGQIPSGLTFEPVFKEFLGTSGVGSYEAVDGFKLSGVPKEKGTYTFTVILHIPYVAHVNVWDQPKFGHGDLTYSREVSIQVN